MAPKDLFDSETQDALRSLTPKPPAGEPLGETLTEAVANKTAWQELEIPRLSDEQLRGFINDFLGNKFFTSAHLREHEFGMLTSVFFPIALGMFSDYTRESIGRNLGLIYEEYSQAMPMAVNGLPMFVSCRLMHKLDWDRARKVIHAEMDRRKNIELPPVSEEG